MNFDVAIMVWRPPQRTKMYDHGYRSESVHEFLQHLDRINDLLARFSRERLSTTSNSVVLGTYTDSSITTTATITVSV